MALDLAIDLLQFQDVKSKVSANDKQTNFLEQKLVAGANMTINKINSGNVETLEFVAVGGGGGDNGMFGAPNEAGTWAVKNATTEGTTDTTINIAGTSKNFIFNSVDKGDLLFNANSDSDQMGVTRGGDIRIQFLTDATGGVIAIRNASTESKVTLSGGGASNFGIAATNPHSIGIGVPAASVANKLHINTDVTADGILIEFLGDKQIHFRMNETSSFNNTVKNNLVLGGEVVGASANNVYGALNGTEPAALANCVQWYAKDISAGNSSFHIRNENGDIIKLYQTNTYTRNATIVEDRTLLASASATTLNNNNVLAALIADLTANGLIG